MPQGTSAARSTSSPTPRCRPTQVNTGQVFDQSYMQNAAIGSGNRDYQTVLNQAPESRRWTRPIPQGLRFDGRRERLFHRRPGHHRSGDRDLGTVTSTSTPFGEIQFQTGASRPSTAAPPAGSSTWSPSRAETSSPEPSTSATARTPSRRAATTSTLELDSHTSAVLAATLGGPILRDKLWFFAAYELINSELTPTGSPTTRSQQGAELPGQAHLADRPRAGGSTGKFSGDPAESTTQRRHYGAGGHGLPRAGHHAFVSAELSAVLSDSLMWNMTLGLYRFETATSIRSPAIW